MSRHAVNLQRLRSVESSHGLGLCQARPFSSTSLSHAEPPARRPSQAPKPTARPSQAPVYQSSAAVQKLRDRLAQKGQGRGGSQSVIGASSRAALDRAQAQRSSKPSSYQGTQRSSDSSSYQSVQRSLRPRFSDRPRPNRSARRNNDDGPGSALSNEQKQIISASYFEDPVRPSVPFDPSHAADLDSYDHPGLPNMSTGNEYGARKMRDRILGNQIPIPRRETFDTYEAAAQTPISKGGYVKLPEEEAEAKELLQKTWLLPKDKRFKAKWTITPVGEEAFEGLVQKYVAGKYEIVPQGPAEDPSEEIARRAEEVMGANGSYGVRDARLFMGKIRELMPKTAGA